MGCVDEGRVAGVLDTDLENWLFDCEGEIAGDLYSLLYDTVSYSEKSINESKGSRQLAWEFDVDILDDDCVEDDILSVGIDGSRVFDRIVRSQRLSYSCPSMIAKLFCFSELA